jgi:hypothetical protein
MTTSETVEVYLHTSSISAQVGGVSDQFHVKPVTSAWTGWASNSGWMLGESPMLGIERRSPHQKTQYWTLRMSAADTVSSTG